MKRPINFSILVATAILLTPALGYADGPQLSPERLNMLDRRGYFTPPFKQAVHDLVDAKKAVVDAKAQEEKLNGELPELEKQLTEADDKTKVLHKQFDELNHVDESEFVELQKAMTNPDAKLEEQRILAQAYVWGYPSSPHQEEAQKDLADVQKKIADQAKAEADAEAARVAAHAKLVERAQAKDLNVNEWRDLLLTMSKQDLLKFLGKPDGATQDEWVYNGAWTLDPISQQKVGLHISFNGGRVINVSETAH